MRPPNPKPHRRLFAWMLLLAALILTACRGERPSGSEATPVPPVVRTVQNVLPTPLPPTPEPSPTASPLPPPRNLTPAQTPPQMRPAQEGDAALPRPGSVTVMWEPEALAWVNGWCAEDAAALEAETAQLRFRFFVDGQEAPLDLFRSETVKEDSAGQVCLRYTTVLETWPPGLHRLRMEITADGPLLSENEDLTRGALTRESLIFVSDPPTESALLERSDLWAELLAEDFSSPQLTWQVGEMEDEWFAGEARIQDGTYNFSVREAFKNMVYRHPPALKVLSGPYEVQASLRRISGESEDACYGLYLHYDYDSGNFYQFTVCDSQSYTVELFKDGAWDTRIPRSTASGVRPGEFNRLGVKVAGSLFTFSVNGETLAELQDESLYRGYAGVFFKAKRGDAAAFALDAFRLRAP